MLIIAFIRGAKDVQKIKCSQSASIICQNIAKKVVPSIAGGVIFMIVGLYIITKRDKLKVFVGLTILSYSFILVLQTIWLLFIFPNFYPQLIWYVSTNIFMNYPIFFRMLGVIITPIVGSIIFMAIGLITTKISLKKEQLLLEF